MTQPNAQRATVVNADVIPEDLRRHDHWVVWQYHLKPGKPGEFTKVPFNAVTLRKASTTDPATWASFAVALACYQAHCDYTRPQPWLSGIGFVLTSDLGIVGLDFDHVRDPDTGEVKDWVRQAVEELDTYTEWSPSGNGLRAFALGTLSHLTGRKRGDMEMYVSGRYLTLTGNVVRGPL